MATSTIKIFNATYIKQRVLTAGFDMNTVVQPGFYAQMNTDMPANAPEGAYNAAILVLNGRPGVDFIQWWYTVNKDILYTRRYTGGTWTPWKVWH